MARTKPSKQFLQDEIDRFLMAAEALHKSIVRPLLAYNSEHYRALQHGHEPLLESIEKIPGKPSPLIQWNLTGPSRPYIRVNPEREPYPLDLRWVSRKGHPTWLTT